MTDRLTQFTQKEITEVLQSPRIKEGALTFGKAAGILELYQALRPRITLTVEFSRKINEVAGVFDDSTPLINLHQPGVNWSHHTWASAVGERSISGRPAPKSWVDLMDRTVGPERAVLIRILRNVSGYSVPDLGILRRRAAEGTLVDIGIPVRTQAFLFLGFRKSDSSQLV